MVLQVNIVQTGGTRGDLKPAREDMLDKRHLSLYVCSDIGVICASGFQGPELLNCREGCHHPGKADLWSLGACLYTMVTGVYTNIHHSLAKSYKQAFKFPMSVMVSDSCKELLTGVLEYLPNHRWVSTSNFIILTVAGTVLARAIYIEEYHVGTDSRRMILCLEKW